MRKRLEKEIKRKSWSWCIRVVGCAHSINRTREQAHHTKRIQITQASNPLLERNRGTRPQLCFHRLTIFQTFVLTDKSFANENGMKSQRGYLILMVDNGIQCNILLCGSNNCQRIARFIMEAESQARILGFDFSFLIKSVVEDIFEQYMTIKTIIDSKIELNIVAK